MYYATIVVTEVHLAAACLFLCVAMGKLDRYVRQAYMLCKRTPMYCCTCE